MFEVKTLSDEELLNIRLSTKGGKEKKAALLAALEFLNVGQYIDVSEEEYSYVSVRARVSELSSKLMDRVFKTQRLLGATRVIRLR
jgi:hypothetical protein